MKTKETLRTFTESVLLGEWVVLVQQGQSKLLKIKTDF